MYDYDIETYRNIEAKMKEIICRKRAEDSREDINSLDVYNELIQSGLDVPNEVMHDIFTDWEDHRLIKSSKPLGDTPQHGARTISKISEDF